MLQSVLFELPEHHSISEFSLQPVASAASMHVAAPSFAVQSYLKQSDHWLLGPWQLSQPLGCWLHSLLFRSAKPTGFVWD